MKVVSFEQERDGLSFAGVKIKYATITIQRGFWMWKHTQKIGIFCVGSDWRFLGSGKYIPDRWYRDMIVCEARRCSTIPATAKR